MTSAMRIAGAECMTARGIVCRTRGEDVEIRISPGGGCAGCEGACGWRRPRAVSLALRFAGSLEPGEEVAVTVPARRVLASALLLHGMPWLALLAGAVAGDWATQSDLGCLAGAAAGVLLAILLRRWWGTRLDRFVLARVELHPMR